MKALDVLKKGKMRISNPKKWTKGAIARVKGGDSVSAEHPMACQWCLGGALLAETPRSTDQQAFADALSIMFEVLNTSVGNFNDRKDTTHEIVMEALDKGIAIAKERKL